MAPQFRLAREADVDLLLDFMRQFYALEGYPFDEGAGRAALATLVRDPSLGRAWLIREGDAAIGYVVLTFGYSLEYRGRDAFVDELFLRADWRGRGVGAQAISFVVEQCRSLGVRALHLEVERANAAGQALYRRAGFTDHGRHLLTRLIDG
jgi:GNAT superfamily N-acetyltransferase